MSPARLRFRPRVTLGELIAIGPGKIELLEAIGQTGSISAAARQLGMSYRRAWLLLDELDRCLHTPAFSTAKGGSSGGGCVLTETGEQLVALYRQIEQTAQEANRGAIRRLLGMLRPDAG